MVDLVTPLFIASMHVVIFGFIPPTTKSSLTISIASSSFREGINFLSSGYHVGVNTVGQSLKNANRQLRSDPPNPKMEVGPWNHSTISGDPYRRPLELGSA